MRIMRIRLRPPGCLIRIIRIIQAMMHKLVGLLDSADCWIKSCPAHMQCPSSCPLRSKLAANLACGNFLPKLSELVDQHLGEVMACACRRCTHEEQTRVLDEYLRGKSHILFLLGLKTSCWTALPLKIIGLAHYNEGEARQCMQEALDVYDALTPEEQGRQHPICQKMLGPGPVRIQLCRFIMGAPLDGLPRLLVFASKFRFISVLESRCEAEHNLTRKAIATSPYLIGVRSATCDQAATCDRGAIRDLLLGLPLT